LPVDYFLEMEKNSTKPQGLFASAKYDLPASVVVFFVAVPLCLGIALASGAPLFAGVIAGVIGGVVVGSVSNSALGVSGPAAGLTVIVLSAISAMGSYEAFLVTVVIAGVFQLILGYVGAGVVAYFFPSAVIKGMLSAIGLIIIIKQIPHAVGYDADHEGDLSFLQADGENSFSELIRMIDKISPGAIVVCVIALALMLLWESEAIKKHRVLRFVQGPIVAVFTGILYQIIMVRAFPDLALRPEQLVNVPVANSAIDFLGQFTFPDFSHIARPEAWITGLTIAIVASVESLLSVEATDKLDPQGRVTNTNRELVAQGTGNILSGLIGGLPVTQVILRSSTNIHSGAKTRLSAIAHGVLLLACVAMLPTLLNLVPLAVLAAILFLIGMKLVNPSTFRELYRIGWSQFLPFIATVVGVVLTDLLTGIAAGVVVAVIIILRNSYRNSYFLHVDSSNGSAPRIRIELAEEVYFLNKAAIRKELGKIRPGSFVTIDASRCVSIDHDVKEVIRDFKKTAASKGIVAEIIERTPRRDVVRRAAVKEEELISSDPV
jgi:MFS superfamily sulfate permease-like transporter